MNAVTDRKLTSSQEDYLEAILYVIHQKRVARVRDIARYVGVGMPSVTSALKTLSKRKLVNYEAYEAVTLTGRGREVARGIRERHDALRRFFVGVLGLDAETADSNACRIEHVIDDRVLRRMGYLAQYIEHRHGREPEDWLDGFTSFCDRLERQDRPAAAGPEE